MQNGPHLRRRDVGTRIVPLSRGNGGDRVGGRRGVNVAAACVVSAGFAHAQSAASSTAASVCRRYTGAFFTGNSSFEGAPSMAAPEPARKIRARWSQVILYTTPRDTIKVGG